MSNLFSKAFFRVLTEQEQPAMPPAGNADAISDKEAMASTLDAGTSPEDFDIHAGTREAAVAAAKSHSMMSSVLDQWITKVTEFSEFLNGQNPESVQSMLSKADDKSLFGVIKSAETKKIALVAKELAGLNEMLKGYRASADDPKYRGS